MTGLYHTLNIGSESLHASRQGVDTTGHNIANAQVEGYSRQRINLEGRQPLETRGVLIGNGVFVRNITRSHDKFVEKQINDSNQRFGSSHARFEEMKAAEGIFSPELGASVSDSINEFFGALQGLSNFPEELTVRAQVRESAQNLVSAFQRVDAAVRMQQQDINLKVQGETEEISTLLSGIAKLNVEINNIETGGTQEAGDLRDQQDRMLRKLSEKIDVSYYRTDQGMLTVRGPRQSLLVDMGYASSLAVRSRIEDGNFYDVVILDPEGRSEKIVTQHIESGRLNGLINVRDGVCQDLLSQNNEMAAKLGENFNEIHRVGYGINDFNHAIGRNFFKLADDQTRAARDMRIDDVILQSIDAISAASSPFAPGDNVVANDLIRLKGEKVLGDGRATFSDYYANFVGILGLDVVRSEHQNHAEEIILKELTQRREAVSGVSLDEEATNLMKWQANFTASSKVITTIDEMLDTLLNIKR